MKLDNVDRKRMIAGMIIAIGAVIGAWFIINLPALITEIILFLSGMILFGFGARRWFIYQRQ